MLFSVSSGYSPEAMIVLHKYMVSLLVHHYTRSGQKRWHGVVILVYSKHLLLGELIVLTSRDHINFC